MRGRRHSPMAHAFATPLQLLASMEEGAEAVPLEGFLEVCRAVLPVVDQLGAGMALVRGDVGGNIERVAARLAGDAERSKTADGYCAACVADGNVEDNAGPAKALLWLTRANLFVATLLAHAARSPAIWADASPAAAAAADQASRDDDTPPCTSVGDCASQAYGATLKPYHGFLASSAFSVALLAVPSASGLVSALGGDCADPVALQAAMRAFSVRWRGVLARVRGAVERHGLWFPDQV